MLQRKLSRRTFSTLSLILCAFYVLPFNTLRAQENSGQSLANWQIPASQNLMPHFEDANGRKILYVDGQPFTVLAVEIPWWDLIYGRYKQTETVYDKRFYLFIAKIVLSKSV